MNVPNNTEKKEALIIQGQIKKRNVNMNIRKSPKFNEVGSGNKQVNGNGTKGKRSNKQKYLRVFIYTYLIFIQKQVIRTI